jgi:hypothetical protein
MVTILTNQRKNERKTHGRYTSINHVLYRGVVIRPIGILSDKFKGLVDLLGCLCIDQLNQLD